MFGKSPSVSNVLTRSRLRHQALFVLAVLCTPSLALAISSDASTEDQSSTNGGLELSIEDPDTDNDDDGPDGRLFCTLYDEGECVPVNRGACDGSDQRLIKLEISPGTATITSGSLMFVFATRGDCPFATNVEPDDSTIDDLDLNSSSPLVDGSTFEFPEDFGTTSYGTVADLAEALDVCADGNRVDDKRYRLCIGVSVAADGTAENGLADDAPYVALTLLVDTVPPDAPTDVSTSGGDSRLHLHAGLAEDNDTVVAYVVHYRVSSDDGATDCSSWSDYEDYEYTRDSTPDDPEDFTLDDLDNGVTYDVCIAARDGAGNVGAFSAVMSAQTRAECGFIGCYPGEAPTGYCGQVSGSTLLAWLLTAFVGAGALRRLKALRRSNKMAVLCGIIVTVLASEARAQSDAFPSWEESSPANPVRSSDAPSTSKARSSNARSSSIDPSPRFAIELRLGPYRPELGSDAARDLYAKVYTPDKSLFKNHPLIKQLEVDWYPFNTIGLAGVYSRVGYWVATGHARTCATDEDPAAVCTPETVSESTQGSEKDKLMVVPIELGLVYKYDIMD